MMIDIRGNCPMGCGQTLHVEHTVGMVFCIDRNCPDSGAAHKLLQDEEHEHIIVLHADPERPQFATHWTARHPLRERIEGDLFECPVIKALRAVDTEERPLAQTVSPGVYRVRLPLSWEPI
jgi:hypothetical protein